MNLMYIIDFFWCITFYVSKKIDFVFKKGEKNNAVSMLILVKNLSN